MVKISFSLLLTLACWVFLTIKNSFHIIFKFSNKWLRNKLTTLKISRMKKFTSSLKAYPKINKIWRSNSKKYRIIQLRYRLEDPSQKSKFHSLRYKNRGRQEPTTQMTDFLMFTSKDTIFSLSFIPLSSPTSKSAGKSGNLTVSTKKWPNS